MRIFALILIILVLVSGCSKLTPAFAPPTPRPTPTSSVVVSEETIRTTYPTAVPYEAPTIEKITVSRYKKPTPTITTIENYWGDPIVGRWESDDWGEAIFATSGSGNSDLGAFSWYSTEGTNYTISLYGAGKVNITYNANDTLTIEGYLLMRK